MTTKTNNTFWFKLIAMVLPFVLLVLIELLLRVFNVGYNVDLFIEHPENPEYLIFNPNVSRRYFVNEANATRGFIEPFKKEKEEGTIRIFVQGGSSAYGFPYENNGSFHRMLQYMFNMDVQEQKVEIINLSLTAVNSYTLVDFANEIAVQNPDAVFIYAGHNEYYGALGVGSSSKLGANPLLVKLGIQFRKLRMGQFLMKLFLPSAKSSESDIGENLMKRMVAQQSIPEDSELFRKGIAQFENNMKVLLQRYQKNNIPVYLGTVVSNLKDQPPFVSDSTASPNADDYFAKANQQLEVQYYGQAKQNFKAAKDADMLRFRAPEEINESLKKLAEENDVYLVDVEKKFEKNASHGIIGEELILEHLHPNLYGYYLLALSFYEGYMQFGLYNHGNEYTPLPYQKLPLTEMDSLFGAYTNLILRSGWPFNESMPDINVTGKSMPEVLAGGLVVKEIEWEEAMKKLAKHYLEQKDYKNLLKTAESLALAFPLNANYQNRAAQYAANLKQHYVAFKYYSRNFQLQPSMKGLANVVKAGLSGESYLRVLYFLGTKEVKQLNNPMVDKIKKDVSALNDLWSANVKAPGNVEILQGLASGHYKFGSLYRAKEFATRLNKIDPENKTALEIIKRTEKLK